MYFKIIYLIITRCFNVF